MTSETIQDKGKRVRILRPSIVVLCGPAACGKSTFAERHFRPTQIISSDWARAWVCDDDRDQRFNAQAFGLVHFLVEQRLSLNRLCVVDSTALTTPARRELLTLAKKFQVPIIAMLFDVPLETCVARDEKRERSVGRSVVERQYEFFEQTKATIRREGFDQILEFNDGELDQVHFEIMFRPVLRQNNRVQRHEAVAAPPAGQGVAPSPPPRVGVRGTPPVTDRKAPAGPAPSRTVARPPAKPLAPKPLPPARTTEAPVVTPSPAIPASPSPRTAGEVGSTETQSTGRS
jgi:protein phosphatase